MLFNEIRRLVARLTGTHARTVSAPTGALTEPLFASQFDPMWHGDHWQNLLSSPMDARRYVMEDWSVTALTDWSAAEDTAPAR